MRVALRAPACELSSSVPSYPLETTLAGGSCITRNPVTGDGVAVTPLRRNARRCRGNVCPALLFSFASFSPLDLCTSMCPAPISTHSPLSPRGASTELSPFVFGMQIRANEPLSKTVGGSLFRGGYSSGVH